MRTYVRLHFPLATKNQRLSKIAFAATCSELWALFHRVDITINGKVRDDILALLCVHFDIGINMCIVFTPGFFNNILEGRHGGRGIGQLGNRNFAISQLTRKSYFG